VSIGSLPHVAQRLWSRCDALALPHNCILLLAALLTSCTGGVSMAIAVVARCAALHCRITVFSDEMRMVMTIMVFEIARHKLHVPYSR
jgi:hypothetical protein